MKRLNTLIVLTLMLTLFGCSNNKNNEEEVTSGYRTIIVSDYSGDVNVTRSEGDNLNAYEGLSLFDGDDVKVLDLSDLTLTVDSDKYLYAEEKTHFWLEATGSEGNTKTRIHLEKGSILCRIDNSLASGEAFEVVTDKSTMSVRGTVFGITIFEAEDGTTFELVNVFDGKVYTNITERNDAVMVEPGECVLIKDALTENDNTYYVKQSQITEEFLANPSGDVEIVTDNLEEAVHVIVYENLSPAYIDELIEINNAGKELVINNEELQEVKEAIVEKQEEVNVEPEEEVVVTPKVEEKQPEPEPQPEPPAPQPPSPPPIDPTTLTYNVTNVTLTDGKVVKCYDDRVAITLPFAIELTAQEDNSIKQNATGNITVSSTWNNDFKIDNLTVDECDYNFAKQDVQTFILTAMQDPTNTYKSDAETEMEKYRKTGVVDIIECTEEVEYYNVTIVVSTKFIDDFGGVYISSSQDPITYPYSKDKNSHTYLGPNDKPPNDSVDAAIKEYFANNIDVE